MLLEVMLLADPYLFFSGTGGKLRKMSECPSDMAAYWKLSDSIIKQIETSYAPVSCRHTFICLSNLPGVSLCVTQLTN
jgi:hypothetical protein